MYYENLEKQFCTLAQSQKLKALGIVQDSIRYFSPNPNTDQVIKYQKLRPYTLGVGTKIHIDLMVRNLVLEGYYDRTYAAFNVSEFGKMLGLGVTGKPTENNSFSRFWYSKELSSATPNFNLTSEAQYRADMLIQALEKKYLTPNKVNKRLLK